MKIILGIIGIILLIGCSSSLVTEERVRELEATMEGYRLANDRLGFVRAMIASHPDKKIQEDLAAWEESGLFRIEFEEAFPNGMPAGTGLWQSPDGKLGAQLGIGDSFYARSPQKPWMVLAHEYWHIKEIVEGTADLSWRTQGITRQNSVSYFREEMNAYVFECEFAAKIQSSDLHQLCVDYQTKGREGLERSLFEEVIKNDSRFVPYFDAIREEVEKK